MMVLKRIGLIQGLNAGNVFKCCAVLLIIFSFNISNAQVQAEFTTDTTSGCAPLIVQFFDVSLGKPTNWFWELGNGITSTQQNPTTFYFEPGSYTIKLTAVNGNDTSRITKQQYISAYASPSISFNAITDTVGCSPFNVAFADFSKAGSGSITSRLWDYGDGNFVSDPKASHSYTVAGKFNVTQKIVNTYGCSSTKGKANYITVNEGVSSDFGISKIATCKTPAVIRFTDSSQGVGINKYFWDFGDGNFSTEKSPLHSYTNWGSYNVSLAVGNSSGCFDTIFKPSAVVIGTVTTGFIFKDSTCLGTPVNFTNTSVPLLPNVVWHFGDGTSSTAANSQKTYNKEGTYTVSLINNNNGCYDTLRKQIVIVKVALPNFTSSFPVSSCSAPLSIDFKSGTSATGYLWNFGDQSTATTANPTHVYDKPGYYNVSLTITGSNGCTNTVTKNSYVYIGPTVIQSFKGLPFKDCAPSTLKLAANILKPEPIATYNWDFGDGTTSSDSTPAHTWLNPGVYAVTLSITTVSGCSATYTLPNAYTAGARPKANFNAAPVAACAFQQINFNDASTGQITDWLWKFGDGATSQLQNPVHAYTDTGQFSVTLLISNNGCTDSLKLSNYITILPPVAKFSNQFNCVDPGLGTFSDKSIGATSWNWDFGDGTSSTDANPVHKFVASGNYKVTLQVLNRACRHQYSEDVKVINEKAFFTIDSKEICKNTTSKFTASGINTSLIQSYAWYFGDGKRTITTDPFVNYSYTVSGNYSPKLVTTDINGCKDTSASAIAINIYGPEADFSTSKGTCINNVITFNDASKSYAGYPITKWSWNYGDGIIEENSVGPFNHIFTTEGYYKTTLTVTDNKGCTSVKALGLPVLITRPVANFTVTDSINCTLNKVTFGNQSSGVGLKYVWNFGDGTTSTQNNSSHSYLKEGIYSINLVISDTFGCRDSIFKKDVVKIADVHAFITVSDTASSCPPFKVSLKHNSANYNSVLWNFDDGGYSSLDTPSHYYITPGNYNLQLIAKGFAGCADTVSQKIVLKGPTGALQYYPANVCTPGNVTFKASTNNRTFLIWDYGDGNTFTTSDSIVTYTYAEVGKYVPKLLLIDRAGCQVPVVGKDTISSIRIEAGISKVPTLYCDSATVQFADSSIAWFDELSKFEWDYGDGTIETASSKPVHHYASPGNYKVKIKVTTTNGCSDTASLQQLIQVIKSPVISVSGKAGVCVFDTISFSGNLLIRDTSVVTWKWSYGDGAIATGISSAAKIYMKAGYYQVAAFATNSSGCVTPYIVPLEVYELPNVTAGVDTTICQYNEIVLKPDGAQAYQWNADNFLSCSGCQSPVAHPLSNTTFFVQGTSAQGCKNRDSVLIKVIGPFKMMTSPNDTLCLGESININATGTDNYLWSPAVSLNNNKISNPVATPKQTTTYQVIASDSQYCYTDTAFIQATVYPVPKFNVLQDEITLQVGESIALHTYASDDVIRWRWVPSHGLSCNNCPNPVASPRNTTTYIAEGINQGGCKTLDKVTITVICNNANIFIPNTFSPNKDGMNDVFYPRGKGIAHIGYMTIFNRWGELVYSKKDFLINDINAGWNGKKGETPQPAGVYIYKIDVVCENNQVFNLSGNITLVY